MLDFAPTLGLQATITQHIRCFLSALQLCFLALFLQCRHVVLIYPRTSPSLTGVSYRYWYEILSLFTSYTALNLQHSEIKKKNDSAFIVFLELRRVCFCALFSVLQSCISLYGHKIERWKSSMTARNHCVLFGLLF